MAPARLRLVAQYAIHSARVQPPGVHGQLIGQVAGAGFVEIEEHGLQRAVVARGHKVVVAVRVAVAQHLGQLTEREDAVVQALAKRLELRAQFGGQGGRAQQVLQGAHQQVVQVQRVVAGAAGKALAGRMQLRQAPAKGLDALGLVAGGRAVQVLEQHERTLPLGQLHPMGDLAGAGAQAGGHRAAARAQVLQHIGLERQVGLAARALGAQPRHHMEPVGQREPVHLVEAAPQKFAGHHLPQGVVRLHHAGNGRGRRGGLRNLQIQFGAPDDKGARL